MPKTETEKKNNSLAALFPHLVDEWDYEKNGDLLPSQCAYGSNRKVWWKCSTCGNEWSATINHRANGRGCPKCAKKRAAEKLSKKNLIVGQTDLKTLYPKIANQWNPTKNNQNPEDFSPFSLRKVWWVCEKGHEYQQTIANRTAQHQGCPYCAGKKVLAGYNDLQSQFPEIAKEWDYQNNSIKPTEITARSSKTVYWKCSLDHSYSMVVSERTRSDGKALGCPYCAGKRVLVGYNDLASVRPELAKEWDFEKNASLKPTDVVEFSMKSVYWLCEKGHSWRVPISSRSSGTNCPYCANKKLLVGYNDLKTTFPTVAEEWDYEKNERRPEDYIAGSHYTVWWNCPTCGNKWQAQIKERAFGKTGCPKCTFYHKTSFPEQAVYYYIKQLFLSAVNSYKPDFLAPREIDVYIPELSLGIEYDGQRWHQSLERDLKKEDILREHGIQLIHIREDGTPELPSDCIVFQTKAFSGELEPLEQTLKEVLLCILAKNNCGKAVDIDLQRDYSRIKTSFAFPVGA